jgi:hypothetical protein
MAATFTGRNAGGTLRNAGGSFTDRNTSGTQSSAPIILGHVVHRQRIGMEYLIQVTLPFPQELLVIRRRLALQGIALVDLLALRLERLGILPDQGGIP